MFIESKFDSVEDNTILIECACGYCYLKIFSINENEFGFSLYQNKKLNQQKLIDEFNKNFVVNKLELEHLINQLDLSWLGQYHDGCIINNYLIELESFSCFNSYKDEEYDAYVLSFYKINRKNRELVFDIYLDNDQINKLYNSIQELIK